VKYAGVSLLLIAVTVIGALSACATAPPAPQTASPPRVAIVEQELQGLLSSDQPQRVFPRLAYYGANSTLLSKEALDEFFQKGVVALTEAFQSSIGSRNYSAAETYLVSLEALAAEKSLPGGLGGVVNIPTEDSSGGGSRPWTVDELRLRVAESYRVDGNQTAALDELLRISNLENTADAETLLAYGKIAASLNDRTGLTRIITVLRKIGQAVPEDLAASVAEKPTAAEMLSGTVTIWVNRGIKVDRGVGYPDRVIGSGFFVDPRGYLITNYHVISSEVDPTYEGFSRLFIRLPTKPDERIPARVVGFSRIFDIALLKVEIVPAYVFSFTQIRKLDVGTRVFAMGSPGGLESTISAGIISATGRRFLQLGDAIQVDVAVNPGNSGGPLVDDSGNLVGVVFAGIQQFQGVNFAIPSFWIEKFLPILYKGGEVSPSWIGVAVREAENGLEAIYVAPGSPADRAGMRKHDIITELGSSHFTKIGDAQSAMLSVAEDALISIKWTRNGETQSSFIVPSKRPYSPVEDALKSDAPADLFPVLFGMDVSSTSSYSWQRDFVVTNVYPGTAADETGLSVRDPISVLNWQLDKEKKAAILQISVRKRKEGFLSRAIQLGAYVEVPNFI